MNFKIKLLILVLICEYFSFACVSPDLPEIRKVSEIIYHNYSNDIIDKIEIKLIEDRTKRITDVITINKSINPRDSLVFNYNTENFMNMTRNTEFFTTVTFRNQEPIYNKMLNINTTSGSFPGLTFTFSLYIGNKVMTPCVRLSKNYPDVILGENTCDKDSLY